MGRVAHAALLFLYVVMAMGVLSLRAEAQLRREQLVLQTPTAQHVFDIEIAETSEQKTRGLMFRRSMPENAGMLFFYLPAQEITMWMRNTYIPLDMIFIRSDGTIHRIEHMTQPFSETVIASQGDVAAVLEINGGAAQRLGLQPGDKVSHPYFKSGKK